MPRLCFLVAYDGRPYQGWQSQVHGKTVQDYLEKAIASLIKEPIRIHGSGRTDTGVHATGQVFHADIPDQITLPCSNWPQAINTRLPDSIRVLHTRLADQDFHARFSAIGKTYRYSITKSKILSPFAAGLTWHRPKTFDVELLSQAIAAYSGTHDFRSFAALRGNEPSPIPSDYFIRTITKAELVEIGDDLTITLSGSGFLYKMVRLMVGGAFEVARKQTSWSQFMQLLNEPNAHTKSPLCAPADGLTLHHVHYDKDPFAE